MTPYMIWGFYLQEVSLYTVLHHHLNTHYQAMFVRNFLQTFDNFMFLWSGYFLRFFPWKYINEIVAGLYFESDAWC